MNEENAGPEINTVTTAFADSLLTDCSMANAAIDDDCDCCCTRSFVGDTLAIEIHRLNNGRVRTFTRLPTTLGDQHSEFTLPSQLYRAQGFTTDDAECFSLRYIENTNAARVLNVDDAT